MAPLRITRLATLTVVAGCTLIGGTAPVLSQAKEKTTIGRVEKVWIGEANVVLRAKIDTGAHTSSLGADHIEMFKRSDREWVRFSFFDEAGDSVTLERRLVEFKPLKERNESGTETRPVVLLKLCIADIYRLTRVNLTNRKKLNYPILVGRRFLFGRAIVDVSRQYTSEPHCKEMGGR